jgi:hypothetical protein
MIKDKIKNIKLRRLHPIEQLFVLTLDESEKVYSIYDEKCFKILNKNKELLFTWNSFNRTLVISFEMRHIYFRNNIEYCEIDFDFFYNLCFKYINPMNGKKTWTLSR